MPSMRNAMHGWLQLRNYGRLSTFSRQLCTKANPISNLIYEKKNLKWIATSCAVAGGLIMTESLSSRPVHNERPQ